MSQISVCYVTWFVHYSLKFFTSRQCSCLECKPQLPMYQKKQCVKPFSISYNKYRNGLVSRKSLISLMYVASHLKTLFFFSKMNYTWVIFYNSCSHIYQFFDKRNIYKDFCNHTGLHIWSLSDSNRTRTPNHLVCKQTTI